MEKPVEYQSREYCRAIKCNIQILIDKGILEKRACKFDNCIKTAYQAFEWLQKNNYVIIKNACIQDGHIYKYNDLILDVRITSWDNPRRCYDCSHKIERNEKHLEILVNRTRSIKRIYLHMKCIDGELRIPTIKSKEFRPARVYLKSKDYLVKEEDG